MDAGKADSMPARGNTAGCEVAYIRRIDAVITALKSAGVPVIWAGLSSQRNSKASAGFSKMTPQSFRNN